MVNKKLLFSVFFLFMGLCMQAQSVSEGQMDERFNDGDKMPYGWFTKGWEVKDGVVKNEGVKIGEYTFTTLVNEGSGSNKCYAQVGDNVLRVIAVFIKPDDPEVSGVVESIKLK